MDTCLQPFEYEGAKISPISHAPSELTPFASSSGPPRITGADVIGFALSSLSDLRRVQTQWLKLLNALRDHPVGTPLRLPSMQLVPVIVKSDDQTEVRYRPKTDAESSPGYISVVFLFAGCAHKIRTCEDEQCGKLYIARRKKTTWCSDRCRIRNGVKALRRRRKQ